METTVGSLNLNNIKVTKERVCFKTVRIALNFVTNILLVLTVFVSLIFSCRTSKLSAFELHIILCVLGYQFFMCQGILALSKYNSLTMFMKRQQKRHLHWILQLLAMILVIVGSFIIIKEKQSHFDTAHGISAFIALILSVLGFLSGWLVFYPQALGLCGKVFSVKFVHYLTGFGTLFCAAASLCYGFDKRSFRNWIDNDNAVHALMILSWLFTIAVSLEFWIAAKSRSYNLICK